MAVKIKVDLFNKHRSSSSCTIGFLLLEPKSKEAMAFVHIMF